MFLKRSYFFYTIQVQFKNILNFISLKINENIHNQYMFYQCRKKRHMSKFLILIVTIVIQINEKNMKNKYKTLLNFEIMKSKWYKWF